jgi:hypothetical protein
MIKSRRMRWVGHVVRIGETWNVYSLLVRKPKGKKPIRGPSCRWVVNIKMSWRDRKWGIDWIGLAQNRDKWGALVNATMNVRIP